MQNSKQFIIKAQGNLKLKITSNKVLPESKKNILIFSIYKALTETDSESAVHPISELKDYIRATTPLAGTPAGAVQAYMCAQDWTQIKLAKKTGIPQGNISQIVKGKRPIGKATAEKFGKAFGVDYRKFL